MKDTYGKFYVTGTDPVSVQCLDVIYLWIGISPLLHLLVGLDCKGILKDFWDIRHCQEKSTEFIYGQDEGEENIMLTSCCDKKASVTRMWWY